MSESYKIDTNLDLKPGVYWSCSCKLQGTENNARNTCQHHPVKIKVDQKLKVSFSEEQHLPESPFFRSNLISQF